MKKNYKIKHEKSISLMKYFFYTKINFFRNITKGASLKGVISGKL